ncbi:PQQ-dependent sugar dehydrogenase [Niastella caeni]|uniref:PQQ-dependent sugar dehydrogenase n=1 Tax=Niastella caeni TaxID=2569763 RepID=A0A4S8HWY6_9BACT|nr:PQQ-dependent sugar dehydrogenase [Niastella caeni]THU40213.1 PQQ-dependent sugar dehydrogenase [Niastella caeni]
MRINQSKRSSRSIPAFTVLGTVVLLGMLVLQGCQKHHEPNLNAVDLQLIAEDFVSPIQVVTTHHSERLYVVDQVGKVWVVDGNGYKRPTPLLDLSSKLVTLNPAYDERGLLGIALHEDFKTNGRLFVYYQAPPRAGGPVPGASWNNLSRISEFTVSLETQRADMNSERIILEWDDPQSNHNGGTLVFGLDDFLYISIGDGGRANDTGPGHVDDWYLINGGGNAQNIEANFLGKILRIDVDGGTPYSIPASNPFVGKPGRDEIFAFGFRNPYRMSFDMGGEHQLIVADAGQVLREEVNVLSKGGNYGWNIKEGKGCFSTADSSKELASCPSVDDRGKAFIDPVLELNNWQNPQGGKATTIIGGYVYRGNEIKSWQGKYVFGSFSQTPTTPNGELFIARPEGSSWSYDEVSLKSNSDDIGYYLRGFGQDDDGEIYVTVSSTPGPQGTTGKVFKLIATTDEK